MISAGEDGAGIDADSEAGSDEGRYAFLAVEDGAGIDAKSVIGSDEGRSVAERDVVVVVVTAAAEVVRSDNTEAAEPDDSADTLEILRGMKEDRVERLLLLPSSFSLSPAT